MAKQTPGEPPWLAVARTYLGVREIAGPRHNTSVMGWVTRLAQKHKGLAWITAVYTGDEVPWCGLFVAEVMDRAGYAPPPKMLAARGWLDFGQPLNAPALGAIAVFRRSGGGHVGFLAGMSAGQVQVLGGNQADRVCIRGFAVERLVGLRWPSGAPAPRPLPKRAAATPSTTEA